MPFDDEFEFETEVIKNLCRNGWEPEILKFKTEKDLQKLTLENILEINGITIPEMSVITELQKQVKAGTLYSYLGGGENEQSD